MSIDGQLCNYQIVEANTCHVLGVIVRICNLGGLSCSSVFLIERSGIAPIA